MTYDNIWKIETGQGDDYTTGFLLDYNYFNNYYKMIVIDLIKTKNTQYWSESNTANQFFCKYRSRQKHSYVCHYWKSGRNIWIFHKEL